MNAIVAAPRIKRPDIRRLFARSYDPIPASYLLTAAICTVVLLVCFATTRWVPFLGNGNMDMFYPVVRFFGPALVVLGSLLLGACVSSSVWLALRWPWLAIAVALLPMLATVSDPAQSPVHFGVFMALAAVALTAGWRRPVASVVAVAVAIALAWLWIASRAVLAAPFGAQIDLHYTPPDQLGVLYTVVLALVVPAALLLRRAARREVQRRALSARAVAVEEQATAVAERARLSRDLHDVVAHHVSLIAVRAETSPYTHPELGDSARRVLADIAADARLALDELRGVLGILGRAGDQPDRSPQPAWADVWALVERSRTAGLEVTLDGDRSLPVGAAEGYVAYRVVQESLTNARKHAPGEAVAVSMSGTDRLVTVRVESALPTEAQPCPPGGQGLVGMRERVEAIGGRLHTGPEGGRFVVEATLPSGGPR